MTAIDPIKVGRALAAGIAISDALPDDFLVDLDGGRVVSMRWHADGSLELFVDGDAVPGRYVPHLRIEYLAPEPAPETRPYGVLIAGDRIRTKTGAYCPVESTREVGADKVSVAVVLDGKVVTLVKDKTATTTVVRGQAGRVADLFGDVQVIES